MYVGALQPQFKEIWDGIVGTAKGHILQWAMKWAFDNVESTLKHSSCTYPRRRDVVWLEEMPQYGGNSAPKKWPCPFTRD